MSEQRTESPADTDLALDTIFDLLRNRRRRAVLAILNVQDRTLTVNDLTKEIVMREHDVRITDIPTEEMTQIHLSLSHAHIPKLAAAHVIDYDRDRGLVEPTDRFDSLEPHLSMAIEADPVL